MNIMQVNLTTVKIITGSLKADFLTVDILYY